MRIVGIGGSTREESSTEVLIRAVLDASEELGAKTRLFPGKALVLPPYEPRRPLPRRATTLLDAVRDADAVVFGSPGYHGTVSGFVKNALDYLEDLREDDPPYIDGRAVGCIAIASGWQATVSTLMSLRSVVHALRGWPTPMGAALNAVGGLFDENGTCLDQSATFQLELLGRQVVEFARMSSAGAATAGVGS